MVVLTQFLPVEPFLILGSSLDEIDLDFYLAHRTAITSREDRGPSILVEPNPDPVTESDCKKHDLLLYEGTAEQFFHDLSQHIPDRPTPIELVPRATRSILPADISAISALSFASDFELVPAIATPDSSVSRFLYGQSPTWHDLASNKDIGRPTTARVLRIVDDYFRLPTQRPKILLVEDQTGSGKSTLIRRCAYELAAMGRNSLVCSPVSRIEPTSTANIIDRIPGPLVILVDDFADHVGSVRDLAERLVKSDVLFLCAERRYRTTHVRQTLSGSPIAIETLSGLRLRPIDAHRLIEHYRQFGLVGAPTALQRTSKFAHLIEADPIAIACCRILNDFRPLDRIVESLLNVASRQDLRRYLTSSLAHHCFRTGVRFSVLSAILGRATWNLQLTTDHALPLSRIVYEHASFVVPENTTLSKLVLERISKTDRNLLLTVFVDLANAIASRVNPREIKRRSPEARLAARLFDYDQVVFPFLRDSAIKLYSETKRYWSWNSRYWAQLALMYLTKYFENPSSEEGKTALDNAGYHARHARSIEQHPVVLSTLGKVLLAQVIQKAPPDGTLFEEAFSVLTSAIDLQKNWLRPAGHPFVTLFRGTSDYIGAGGKMSTKHASVLRFLHHEATNLFHGDADVEDALDRIDQHI